MSDERRAEPAYPFAVVATETGVAGSALRFPSLATARDRGELDRLMREQVALYLVEQRLAGAPPNPPREVRADDLADWIDAGDRPEVVYVPPADVNEVSVAIEAAVREEGLAHAELARRMGVPRSVVSRLTDPLYFGHTTRTLRRVASALDRNLHVSFVVPEPVSLTPPGGT
jgi:hypothetical protein